MTASDSHPLLTADRLCRTAEDGTRLLDEVSLSLNKGETVALVGAPGSGKTLLLRALAMLDPLDGGEVRLRGDLVTPELVPRFRAQVIYVQQRPSLIEGTVRENLILPFMYDSHATRSFDEDTIVSRLSRLGRDSGFLDRTTDDLSGGESQMVALLRVLQLDPAVVLLDEPTSSLDQQTAVQVETLLRQWMHEDSHRGMLVVTHDESQAERLAERIVRMQRGQIIVTEEGQP
ncbi:MAG: ATP-binding cassette domain-containing protein [Planctomycetaceae bacterium]|nr:ATP-binding cassette domain-containing protein [Planctomycetaceae bacterium]